jgi:hypothetical protein
MEWPMLEKDDPRRQRERIMRLGAEVFPDCNVVFDDAQASVQD